MGLHMTNQKTGLKEKTHTKFDTQVKWHAGAGIIWGPKGQRSRSKARKCNLNACLDHLRRVPCLIPRSTRSYGGGGAQSLQGVANGWKNFCCWKIFKNCYSVPWRERFFCSARKSEPKTYQWSHSGSQDRPQEKNLITGRGWAQCQ